jgi:ABC-type sugar transport system ATPase subunit
VLSEIDFEVRAGEVHALVGENGSGKSTLIKILTGVLQPRSGELELGGERVRLNSPKAAQDLGVGVVHQDYHLFPELTVAHNIYGVNMPPPRRRWIKTVDRARVEQVVESLLEELGIQIPSTRLVRSLDPAERKFVEIASAMLLRPSFLILDEPTASLEPSAAQSVLDLLGHLRVQGVGLVFVSHRLDEILRIADRITVLRDGRIVASLPASATDEDELADLITGGISEAERARAATRTVSDERALEVSGLRVSPTTPPISFEVRRGEIFGLTGLLGAGAGTVVRMLGGAVPCGGTVTVAGRRRRVENSRDAMRLGIGFIPEDRKAQGLIAEQSIALNVALASLHSVSTAGLLRHRDIDARAERYRRDLAIKAPSVDAPVWALSGGNQQKVMLAKWLSSGVGVLAIEEPTHGVDVGAKVQVHDLLRDFADRGGTVVVASTDVGEVLDLCDRIGVMRHGSLVEVLSAAQLTRAAVTALGSRDPEQILENLVESDTARDAL